jgi:hypothetical protein
MNAKRMLVAGVLALEMSVPFTSYAASTPRPAPDSETTASDSSELVAQPGRRDRERRERRRRAHRRGWEEARRARQRGGNAQDVARAYERTLRRDLPREDYTVCQNTVNLVNNIASTGNVNLVINVIQNNECN